MRIVQGPKAHQKTIAVFSKGDWIEAMALARDPLRMTSVIVVEPTREQIISAMDDNLCRCGAHVRIVAAIQAAASVLAGRRQK